MVISPQACRRITAAVRELEDVHRQEQWGAWAIGGIPNQPRQDVPYYIAEIAFDALAVETGRIERLLRTAGLDEDDEADLLNDLGYIQAIQVALRNKGIGR